MDPQKTFPATTKTHMLYQNLRQLAFELGPGQRLPGQRQLLETFDTTYVLLESVLKRLEAEKIIERKQRQGIFVSPYLYHKAIHILYASPDSMGPPADKPYVMSPFWNMLRDAILLETYRRAEVKAERSIFHFVKATLGQEDALPEDVVRSLETESTVGVLAIYLNLARQSWLSEHDIPWVTFAGGGPWIVQLDGGKIAYLATTALLRQGCKQVELWLPYVPAIAVQEVNEVGGFRRALAEHNIPFSLQSVRGISEPDPHLQHQELGYHLVSQVFTQPRAMWPEGIFIADDLMTDGALTALAELGLHVGQDIQIATHSNVGSPILFGRTKKMTVLAYDPNDIVHAMFSMLDQLIAGVQPETPVIWIPPHLQLPSDRSTLTDLSYSSHNLYVSLTHHIDTSHS